MVTVIFQITFRKKIHVKNIFLFFKNYFWQQHVKTIQNIQNTINFSIKKIKFFKNTICTAFPNPNGVLQVTHQLTYK
jgi:hypothetical protein